MADPVTPAAPAETPPAPTATDGSAPPPPVEAAKATETPKPPEPKRYKVKIEGQELEVDEGELVRGYQRASAANRRFEEAVKARQEAEALKSGIAKDWRAAVRAAGLDPREVAKQEILAAIEEEKRAAEEAQLSPEVRLQLEKARKDREELDKLKAEREAQRKTQLDAQAKAHYDKINVELPKAMEAAHLPKTAEAARLVISKAQAMVRAGVPLDLATAAQAASEELAERNFALLRAMSPTDIVKAIGEDAYKALLKHSVEQVKGGGAKPPAPPAPKNGAEPLPKRQALTAREWDREYGHKR